MSKELRPHAPFVALAVAVFCISSFSAAAAYRLGSGVTRFAACDINAKNEALFVVSQPRGESALFAANVPLAFVPGEHPPLLRPLTCYPQTIESFGDGRLRVRCVYGTATYDTYTATLSMRAADDVDVRPLRFRRDAEGPVKWSPDGSYYVYDKDGKVYFCDPDAEERGVEIDEQYRYICRGTVDSACWVTMTRTPLHNSAELKFSGLFYIEDDTIKLIEQNTIYTQSIYSQVLGHGKILGRLPYTFDPTRDRFSVRPDGMAISVLKAGTLLSVYQLELEGAPLLRALSTVSLDPSVPMTESFLLWGGGNALLWTTVWPWGERENTIVQSASPNGNTKVLMSEKASAPVVSPNGQRVAFLTNGTIRVCATNAWKEVGRYDAERIVSAAWDGNYAIYLGGQNTVSRWIVGDKNAETLFPSSVLSAAWTSQGEPPVSGIDGQSSYSQPVAVSCPNGVSFIGNITSDGVCWQRSAPQKTAPSLQNKRYRIFCASSPNPSFENAIYVRDLGSNAKREVHPVTMPLVKSSAQKVKPKRRIALILDAYSNPSNLRIALNAIKTNEVKATAFLNGIFIARYPEETREIANSGMSCASLFFTDIDLEGGIIKADQSFIARGLARNEDEFLRVTGKELLPLWHAPHYKATGAVRHSGDSAGYKYIDAIDTSAGDDGGGGGTIKSPRDAVARLVTALDTSNANAVSVTVGSMLCREMDYLIASLQDAGYEIIGAEEL